MEAEAKAAEADPFEDEVEEDGVDPALLQKVKRKIKDIPTFHKGKGVLHAIDTDKFPHHTLPLVNPLFTSSEELSPPGLSPQAFSHFVFITYWFPQQWYSWYFNHHPIRCINESCDRWDSVGGDGYSPVRKVAVGLGHVHGLICQRLRCARCSTRFSVLHPKVVRQYPDFVRLDINTTITRRGALGMHFPQIMHNKDRLGFLGNNFFGNKHLPPLPLHPPHNNKHPQL